MAKDRLNGYSAEELEILFDDDGFLIVDSVLYKYRGDSVDIVIPDGVTTIKTSAFSNNKKLRNITFPDTITEIEKESFVYCEKLKELILPPNLKVIKNRAFALCKSLKSVILPENLVQIENQGFARCYELRDVSWNDSLTQIDPEAFIKCRSIETLNFGKSLVKIMWRAFYECESVQSISFPATMSRIWGDAFRRCYALTEIHYKGSDKNNLMCTSQTSFSLRPNFKYLSEDMLAISTKPFQEQYRITQMNRWNSISDKEKDAFLLNFPKKKTFRELVFNHNNADVIAHCIKSSHKLSLSELERYLAHSIKEGSTEVTAILLDYKNNHYSLEVLDDYETNKDLVAIGLEAPTIPQLRENWKVVVSSDCISISGYKGTDTEAVIPAFTNKGKPIENVKYDASNAYGSLQRLVLEDGIKIIGSQAFAHSAITNISLPDSLIEIQGKAFSESALESIEIPENVCIFSQAFFKSQLKVISLPSTLKIIPDGCFAYCQNLSEIHLPEGLTALRLASFKNCSTLKTINIPNTVTNIDHNAFLECTSLRTLTLPSSLKSIGDFCFAHSGLEEIYIPDSVRLIGYQAFGKCKSLKRIRLPAHIRDTFELFTGSHEELEIIVG